MNNFQDKYETYHCTCCGSTNITVRLELNPNHKLDTVDVEDLVTCHKEHVWCSDCCQEVDLITGWERGENEDNKGVLARNWIGTMRCIDEEGNTLEDKIKKWGAFDIVEIDQDGHVWAKKNDFSAWLDPYQCDTLICALNRI